MYQIAMLFLHKNATLYYFYVTRADKITCLSTAWLSILEVWCKTTTTMSFCNPYHISQYMQKSQKGRHFLLHCSTNNANAYKCIFRLLNLGHIFCEMATHNFYISSFIFIQSLKSSFASHAILMSSPKVFSLMHKLFCQQSLLKVHFFIINL